MDKNTPNQQRNPQFMDKEGEVKLIKGDLKLDSMKRTVRAMKGAKVSWGLVPEQALHLLI